MAPVTRGSILEKKVASLQLALKAAAEVDDFDRAAKIQGQLEPLLAGQERAKAITVGL